MAKQLIIFDLDETLITSSPDLVNSDQCESFYVEPRTPREQEIEVFIRPGTKLLLNRLQQKNVQLGFWSAGEKNYVLDILQKIYPQPVLVLWREHCNHCKKETGIIKSVPWLTSKLPQFSNHQVLLVDDLPENTKPNQSKALQLPPFVDGKDQTLLKVAQQI